MRIFQALLLLVLYPLVVVGSNLSLEGKRVVKIRLEGFSAQEGERVAKALSLKEGAALRIGELSRGIRELYLKQSLQEVSVHAETLKGGVEITIRGEALRQLRNISYVNLDPRILEEIKERFEREIPFQKDVRCLPYLKNLIVQVYESRGLYNADIQVILKDIPGSGEKEAEVIVRTGETTLVKEVNFIGPSEKESVELRQYIALKKGGPYSRALLEESVKDVNRFLSVNQYLSSKIEDTRVEFIENRQFAIVSLFVKMEGRFQFEFHGNQVFDEVELRQLMTTEVLSHPNAPQRVASLIEDKYKRIGYHFCKVKPVVTSEKALGVNIIQMDIDEGPKVIVDRVVFLGGVELPVSQLGDLFFESSSGVLAREVYWEGAVEPALIELGKKLRALGFLSNRISLSKTLFREDRRGVEIHIDIEMGIQTEIDSVSFVGFDGVSVEELRESLPFKEGDPLDRDLVVKSRENMLENLKNQGYSDVKFMNDETAVEISKDQRTARVVYQISLGRRYYVGEITVEGNLKTRDKVILREMSLETGEPYDPSLIDESEEKIGLLGLFSQVEIITVKDENRAEIKNLKIVVKEIPPGIGEVGLGGVYEEPRFRIRSFGSLGYRNLLGLNHTASTRVEVLAPLDFDLDDFEYTTILGYRTPYPFDLPFSFTSQVGFDRFEVSREEVSPTQDRVTTQKRLRLEGRIEKRLSSIVTGFYRLYRFEATTTDQELKTFEPTKSTVVEDVERVNIGSTGPGIILDYRDDAFTPKQGSYHRAEIEFADPALLSSNQISFVMALSRSSFYIPLTGPFSLVLFGGLGYGISLKENDPLPDARLETELALGGTASIRGYNIREFSSQNAKSTAFYNFRAEGAIHIALGISGVVFFDTGRIFPNLAAIDTESGKRHDGVGFGIRYDTPVGPIKIELGHPIGRSGFRLHVSVGSI